MIDKIFCGILGVGLIGAVIGGAIIVKENLSLKKQLKAQTKKAQTEQVPAKVSK